MGAEPIRDVKMEDAAPSKAADGAASSSNGASKDGGEAMTTKPYRSWKKKFQKMRIDFDVVLETNEKLHTEETTALQTTKRLAVEIDRILDLLLDVNNTPQIPGSKRIDLSLPRSKNSKALDIDAEDGWERRYKDKDDPDAPLPEPPARSLKSLLADVPHVNLAETSKKNPSLLDDLVANQDNQLSFVVPELKTIDRKLRKKEADLTKVYPESFLTPDDIDNYLWDTDRNIAGRALLNSDNPPPMVPTLAPFAHTPDTHIAHVGQGDAAWDELFNRSIVENDLPKMVNTTPYWYLSNTIARNPVSVYNWLKDHAPKAIFLQEGEATAQAAAAAAAEKEQRDREKDSNRGGDDRASSAAKPKRQPARKSAGPSFRADAGSATPAPAEADAAPSDDTPQPKKKQPFRISGASSRLLDEAKESSKTDKLTVKTRNFPVRDTKRKRTLDDDDAGYSPKGDGGSGRTASARANKRKRKSGSAQDDTEVEGDAADEDADAGHADEASAAADREASPTDA